MHEDHDTTTLGALLTNDLIGITRGRFFPLPARARAMQKGCGWVPANLGLTPFDDIAADNPWGCTGDLRLSPDPDTEFYTRRLGEGGFTGMLCDITTLTGAPWYGCGRSFLKAALEELKTEFGLILQATFEMEFQITGASWDAAPAFSMQAMRRADGFCRTLTDALTDIGNAPEIVLPEYGADQFEMAFPPRPALEAADKAVLTREVIREAARLQGYRATFTPKLTPESVGNGLHIHFSFLDRDTLQPVTHDPAAPGGVSKACGHFVAGIVKQMHALMVFCAPTAVSYMRLLPHHWSSAYASFGALNREAALRICPMPPGADPAKAFNIEFRPTDSTSSPYWALGVLVRAGLEGLRQQRPTPPLLHGDPEALTDAERLGMGITRLPASLQEALDAFIGNKTVTEWFDPVLVDGIRTAKICEIHKTESWNPAELCRQYARIY
ncbi:type I glutamate--ammonia ligase [Gluconobacter kanchanaburiensis]|uniref:Glutamine synthetase n=1 Tax=Gluconobacter kanchanaburiensis NBRC 103587 TaxID=1307948 RepID=A0A511B7Q2_9PROT|nr:glutamine synthetase family protein [Gluconobacter kanchanaburiensis]MBF0862399.1 glutamine synthetase [Gluconobacter kanchanaburiensis]GBR68718.1 glutamine synthetase catalytic region [Gluconobacter kanchanaburiensis NBRC 103587]GEK96480.1 glutamine synthetase [Gluconobacter kanchanaburiensis NBRC 103587]